MCNERITKIGRRTNCMWTGLWSLGAMWRKMIQFWEIMEHQNLDNEHLDDHTSMVTRQKSTFKAPHKILKKMFN